MGNTLVGQAVLLFGGLKDIYPHPVVQLGIDADGQARPIAVSDEGALSVAASANSATPSNASISTTSATVFTLEAGEVGYIQNLKDAVLYVRLATAASDTAFHLVLPACVAAGDGSSYPLKIESHMGPVSVYGAAPSYIAWKK